MKNSKSKTSGSTKVARPKALTVIAVALLVMPIITYLSLARQLEYSVWNPLFLFQPDLFVPAGLLGLSMAAGIGLLRRRIRGWHFFLGMGAMLIAYNLYALFTGGSIVYNLGALTRTLLGFIPAWLILRRYVTPAWFDPIEPGRGLRRRKPVRAKVRVDERVFSTRDMDPRGVFLEGDPGNTALNQETEIRLADDDLVLKGRVVRVEQNGMGIAFARLSRSERKKLRAILKDAPGRAVPKTAASVA